MFYVKGNTFLSSLSTTVRKIDKEERDKKVDQPFKPSLPQRRADMMLHLLCISVMLSLVSFFYTLLLLPIFLASLAGVQTTSVGNLFNLSLPLNLTCPPLSPRTEPPQSVYDLRPDDIQVIMGIGDSVMAGFGAKGLQGQHYVSKTTLKEDRGVSFAMGDTFCPLYQYRSSTDVLNSAQSGARSMNLDHELDYLLPQLEKAYKDGHIKKTDWKLMIVFIGSNDMCHSCTQTDSLPPAYAIDVLAAIDRVRRSVPNVLVQIVGLMEVDEIFVRTKAYPAYCQPFDRSSFVLNNYECSCAHTAANRTIIHNLLPSYNEALQDIALHYQTLQQTSNQSFAVAYQPLLVDINSFPIEAISNVDCFHPSVIAHEWFSKELWVVYKGTPWEDELPSRDEQLKQQTGSDADATNFEESPSETRALLSLDPSDWKQHDLYAILGLADFRYKATPAQIKAAHRRKVLKHHPDKKAAKGGLNDDSFFKCISKAYEYLSNPTKRQLYDSVDFGIPDPQVPKLKKTDDFFAVFQPIFDLEARFSKRSTVPVLGDMDSSEEHVVGFYDFWYNFDSWKTFDHLDKDEDEGDTREDKRFIEKKNRTERARRRKEYLARLRNIVEQAQRSDPRIQKFKQDRKRAKDDKRREKEENQKAAQLEREKHETQRKAEQKKEDEVKNQLAMEEKKEKEKYKKLLKKEKKAVKTLVEDRMAFVSDQERQSQINKLELVLDSLGLNQIQAWEKELRDGKSSVDHKAEELMVKEKKPEPIKKHTPSAKIEKHQLRPWHTQEISLLIKATKKYPVGTVRRWQVVANYISEHSGHPVRSEAELLQRVSELKKGTNALAEHEKSELQHSKKHNDDKHLVEEPTINYDDVNQKAPVVTRTWTAEEQKMLEKALQQYPPKWTGEGDRWDHIEAMVTGRTRKECKLRVKALAEQVRANKMK
ncbi:DnaJ (Hsp40), sub C, member 2 [Apophysomyces sp. BC1034]|nr:DnaJ (Hsp40), sub C, member 2 [Apophysomyces sp. BC1034]